MSDFKWTKPFDARRIGAQFEKEVKRKARLGLIKLKPLLDSNEKTDDRREQSPPGDDPARDVQDVRESD